MAPRAPSEERILEAGEGLQEEPPRQPDAQPAVHGPVDEWVLLLIDGARFGDMEDVQQALAAGAELSAPDTSGRTALHMAAANGHLDLIQLLLRRGANVNAANAEGNTPLHWAALNSHATIVEALMEAGANPSALNRHERTPVDEAVDRGAQDILDIINRVVTQRQTEQVHVTQEERAE